MSALSGRWRNSGRSRLEAAWAIRQDTRCLAFSGGLSKLDDFCFEQLHSCEGSIISTPQVLFLFVLLFSLMLLYYECTWVNRKVMRLFLQKMHNIWIQIFQLIFLSSQALLLKPIFIFCYLAFKFWFFLQRLSQKCTLRRLALANVWLFISYTKINFPNQLFNILICI